MFWGVTLENGKRYTQVVDTGFHVSMAAMEFHSEDFSKKGKPISVMIEHEKSEFLLCTLQSGGQVQQPLDLNFIEGEEVTFFLNGQGTVHLTGYLMDTNDMNDTMEMEPSDSDEEEEDFETKGKKRKSPADVNKQIKKKKTGDSEDDDDDSEDEDFEMGDSFGQEDDDTEESSEDEESDDDIFVKKPTGSPKASPQTGKPFTPGSQQKKPGTANAVASPSKQQGKPDSAKKGLQEKTPHKKQQQQQQNSAKKTPQLPAVNGDSSGHADGETPGSKKKRKRKRKLQEGEAQTPKSPKTPDTPKGKQPPTPKSSSRKVQGGTEVTDLTPGSGPVAKKGRFVQITYVGRLKNNQVFDSSKKEPLRFRLGQGEVIKGMDFGIEGMKVGGKRKIVIPPQQGYGSKGSGPIPPNSTLFFDVELKAVS